VDGRRIALCNVDGEFFAIDDVCTHAYASLADGYIEGDQVECPLHGACFDIRTGKVKSAPASVDLKTYPVKVEGDRIKVGVPTD
jgi:nitrite reductase/ring-hydroxylating ferredoxin subunit